MKKCLAGVSLFVAFVVYADEVRRIDRAEILNQPTTALIYDRTIHFKPVSNEAMLFKEVQQIAIDSQSNLFLLDVLRIVKCDPHGKFLQVVGGRGTGPGEYLRPTAFFLNDRDWLTVIDQNRFVMTYDESGIFQRRIAVENGIEAPFIVMPSGRIVGFSRRIDTLGIWKILAVFDVDGKLERELSSSLEKPFKPGESQKPGFVVGSLTHNYSERTGLCSAGSQTICFGQNIEYKLRLCDELGKTKAVIERNEIPESTSRTARVLKQKWGAQYFDSLSFPPTKPYFEKLLGDEEGRIYVIRTADFFYGGTNRIADVFQSSGEFLFRIEFPIVPLCIKNNEAFSTNYDEEGDLKIVIHKMPQNRYKH